MTSRKPRRRTFTESLRVQVEPEVRAALQKLADTSNVSLADAARQCIRTALESPDLRDDKSGETAQRIRLAVGKALAIGDLSLPEEYAGRVMHTKVSQYVRVVRACEESVGLEDVVTLLRVIDATFGGDDLDRLEQDGESALANGSIEEPSLWECASAHEGYLVDELGGEGLDEFREQLRETGLVTQAILAVIEEPERLRKERIALARQKLMQEYFRQESAADSATGAEGG